MDNSDDYDLRQMLWFYVARRLEMDLDPTICNGHCRDNSSDMRGENSQVRVVDPHYVAVIAGMDCALGICELLPEADLVEEQMSLLTSSLQILVDVLEGKHYGTNNLTDFLKRAEETKKQIEMLKGKLP